MSKNKLPKAVLFDWNGTFNDMNVVKEQDKHVGRVEFGLDLTDEVIAACWGRQAEEFFPMLFGRGGDTRPWNVMRDIFISYDHQFPRRLLPGVNETLDILDQAGIVTGVVTSGLYDKVREYMAQGGLDQADSTYCTLGERSVTI